MAVSNEVVTNLSKSKHTIKAQSTETINFMGAYPNYYRITNASNTNLYMGVSMTPTKNFYDMVVPAGSTKLFVDAYGHDNLYMYNPSKENANILITSFKAEFNPTVLAVSEIGTDFSDITINADTAIKSFECPLPSGTNTIGKVGLETAVSKDIQDIKTVAGGTYTNSENLKTSVSNIYNFLLNGITKTNISDILTVLNSIKEKISLNDTLTKVTNVKKSNSYTLKSGLTKTGFLLTAPEGYYISCFSGDKFYENTFVYNEGTNFTTIESYAILLSTIVLPSTCSSAFTKYDIDFLKTDKIFVESNEFGDMDFLAVFKKY